MNEKMNDHSIKIISFIFIIELFFKKKEFRKFVTIDINIVNTIHEFYRLKKVTILVDHFEK